MEKNPNHYLCRFSRWAGCKAGRCNAYLRGGWGQKWAWGWDEMRVKGLENFGRAGDQGRAHNQRLSKTALRKG